MTMHCAGCRTARPFDSSTTSPPDGAIPLVEVSGTPTHNAEGEVAGAVWVLRDITHIARAEQERAKAAHLESLGVLAGGLAHDFNNILTGVVGNLSLAQDLVAARAAGSAHAARTGSGRRCRARARRHQSAADVLQGRQPDQDDGIDSASSSSSAHVSSSAALQWRRASTYLMTHGRPTSTPTRSPRWCTISC